MGKKKKRRSAKRSTKTKQNEPRQKKWPKYPSIAIAVGASLLVTGVYFLTQGEESKKPPPPEPTKLKKEDTGLRETRATLSPQRFRGRVRRAYEIAREIPQVLDRLYCYCRCRANFNHKNLLSCYVGTHASK